jgi:hypothetical protein
MKRTTKKNKLPLAPTPKKTPVEEITPEQQIIGAPFLGKVKNYDAETRLIDLELEESLSVGDGLRIKGSTTDLIQRVEQLRIAGRSVQNAMAGETVSILVADPVKRADAVYKVRLS